MHKEEIFTESYSNLREWKWRLLILSGQGRPF